MTSNKFTLGHSHKPFYHLRASIFLCNWQKGDPDMDEIFLGGTCGNHPWRPPFIANLVAKGVPATCLFNPVMPNWTEEAQKREDEVKATAKILFFHLGNPLEEQRSPHSMYSLVQLVDSVYNVTKKTRVHFDLSFLDKKTAKSLGKIARDIEIRFPGTVKQSWGEFVSDIASLWQANHQLLAFLAGTSGNNDWRVNLKSDLKARGVATDRFFDPTVPSGSWNEGIQKLEDQMRRASDHEFFFIGNPMEYRSMASQISPYSIVEAYMGLHDNSRRIMICFDYSYWEGHALNVMRKFEQDVRGWFPFAWIASSLEEAEKMIVERMR